jgi:hypothetical protein
MPRTLEHQVKSGKKPEVSLPKKIIFFLTQADDTGLKVRWEPVTSLRSKISSPEFSRHSALRVSDSFGQGESRKPVLPHPIAEATALKPLSVSKI